MTALKALFLTTAVAIATMSPALADAAASAQPQPTSSTATTTTKPATEADALAQFADVDAKRTTFTVGTQDRATSAQKAADLALSIAWFEMNAGKYDGAADWFAKRTILSKDAYDSQVAFAEVTCKHAEDMFASKEATANAASKPIWHDTGLSMQITCTSNLEILARTHADSTKLLDLERHDLDLRKQVLQNLQAEHATQDKTDAASVDCAKAMGGVGGALADLGRYDEAEQIDRNALALRQSLGPNTPGRNLDEPLSDIALLYTDMGDFPRAREYYAQALAALNAQPAVAADPGDIPQIKLLRQINAIMEEFKILNNTGTVLGDLGDYTGDLDYVQRALALADTIPSDGVGAYFKASVRAISLGNIATIHADSGQVDLALKEYQDVLEQYRTAGEDSGVAVTLSNLAGIADEQGDFDKARHYQEQARQIYMSRQDLLKTILSDLHLSALARKANDFAKAEDYGTQALTLAKKNGSLDLTAAGDRSLAALRIAQSRPADAAALLDDAAAIDIRVGAPLSTEYTFDLQGQVLEGQRKQDEALAKYTAAINLLEGVRASSASNASDFGSVEDNYRPYEHIVKLLIKMGKSQAAFDYLSRAKSKQLQDTLSADSIKTGDRALQALLDRIATIQSKLDAVQAQIGAEQQKTSADRDEEKLKSLQVVAAQTQAEYYDVSDQIKDKYPDYDQMLTIKPTELASAQDSIPDDAILIEYAPLGDQLYIFTVTKSTLKITTPAVKPVDLWAKIADVRAKIAVPGELSDDGPTVPPSPTSTSPPPPASGGVPRNEAGWVPTRGARRARTKPATAADMVSVTDDLAALYDMLITPIAPEIASKKILLIVPTHQLYYLPMQALAKRVSPGPRSGGPVGEGTGLRFLVQDKQIVYLAAADVLSVVQQRHGDIGVGMTAIGDPTGADLPFAGDEVNAISQIYSGSNVLIGSNASKAAVENPGNWDKRILHFATHGILDSAHPRKSYIQLAEGDNPDDTELTVGEIYGLPLSKVDLVTISACDTAVGEANPGSEILSLATAFSRAKARTVVASLWSVSDDSTKEIMVEFYRQLASGQSKAAALQAAEVKVMSMPRFKHPFFWAPFVLMGDWR